MSVSARTIIEPLVAVIPGVLFITAVVDLNYNGGHHIDLLWVVLALFIVIPGFLISFVVSLRRRKAVWWIVTAINASPLLLPIMLFLDLIVSLFLP